MSTEFPFVEIPKELEAVLGSPDPGTRIYRRDGSQEESAAWFDLLTKAIGPSVSPGGVGMYCPASRAAVYKRIKEGRLSIFLFHVTHRKTTLFGKNKILRDAPYGYVPVSEIRAWRQELEERALRLGLISEEELEGSRPDWVGEFLLWKNKGERPGLLDVAEMEGGSRIEFLKDLVKVVFTKDDSLSAGRRPGPTKKKKQEPRNDKRSAK